jgi:hypothetical protein
MDSYNKFPLFQIRSLPSFTFQFYSTFFVRLKVAKLYLYPIYARKINGQVDELYTFMCSTLQSQRCLT